MYLFYVDESGNPGKAALPSGRRDVFVLASVGVFAGNWRGFNYTLRQHKRDLYEKGSHKSANSIGMKDYEIKSNWIRLAKERAKSPFLSALSEASVENLAEKYYAQLGHHKMALIGVVIDKARLLPECREASWVRAKALELLYERIENFMREYHSRHQAVVVVDDCGAKANSMLAVKHADFLRTKTGAGVQFRHIIETPFFTRSELSEGIQLADLCAYNIYRAFAGGNMDYPYFRKVEPYFYRSRNTAPDKVDGLKMFPSDT